MGSREERIIEAARREAVEQYPTARPAMVELHALTLLRRAVLLHQGGVRRAVAREHGAEVAE